MVVKGWLGACLLALAAGAASAQEPIRLGMIDGLSGPFANAGEAVVRNLRLAIDRVNARGGVRTAEGQRPLELVTFDSKGNVDESLIQFRALVDRRIPFVLQGNSSAVAAALVGAVNRHNARQPDARVLFMNYSAVDPALTNENCSFWHFRFDAGADMRMEALTEVIRADASVRRVYLIAQDYSFGHQVSRLARDMLAAKRPDVKIVGDEFHPIGKIKDFAPYIAKIKASGADAVISGNWGNDLTLMVKAAREGGLGAKFYTFYGNGLGAPAAMGDAGVGRVLAVAEWHPNVGGAASDAFYQAFRNRYPEPKDDYVHLRMQMMVEMLARAIEQAGSTDAVKVARALEGMRYVNDFHDATVRADDHQVLQPLYVSMMERQGGDVRFDNEGSGFGFRTVKRLKAAQTTRATTCKMERP
ncbi:branched-chain amino acid ABC transporter substrate-binding protein [Cupriavidus gilardii]|uniref:Branched-chain amino acid ABC transporter substrate-binding protein n=1 Tax=Cupriavidus gilardii TaxID=82541 RepID=A0A849BHV4_9BURK|nr:branched-chain amino acid ABC transporter substrate-binding protein [Cupriavidus gilardii]KAB0594595.1 branched-chain amino acid ABC transporter substrate-binding protein [Cupriavidus gilardii]MCT9015653.1 branched-chain amino acid ABC transporter substrate-binding protein [Cupriavidus gilardii]MCT9055599.1 branched-chain amino acid ABC transporter substrate-binding protein [Cupriavidus gilardii]NNH12147.1 branched-chain amino acid ABC transporter substrate-binding protein [Cupriavidus gilar